MNRTSVSLAIYLLDNHKLLSPSFQCLVKLPPKKKENVENLNIKV